MGDALSVTFIVSCCWTIIYRIDSTEIRKRLGLSLSLINHILANFQPPTLAFFGLHHGVQFFLYFLFLSPYPRFPVRPLLYNSLEARLSGVQYHDKHLKQRKIVQSRPICFTDRFYDRDAKVATHQATSCSNMSRRHIAATNRFVYWIIFVEIFVSET